MKKRQLYLSIKLQMQTSESICLFEIKLMCLFNIELINNSQGNKAFV